MAFSIRSATIFLLSVVVITTLASADNHLLPGEMLKRGAFLQEGPYMFIMQEDCNLVLYKLNEAEWASGTNKQGSRCYATLQSDGNFVIYDEHHGHNEQIWATNTAGENGNYVLIVQKDGNVVIYGNPIFATGTNRIGSAHVVTVNRNRKALSGAELNKVCEMKTKVISANL